MNSWATLSLAEQTKTASLYFTTKNPEASEIDRRRAGELLEIFAINHDMLIDTLERQCRSFLYYEKLFLGRGVLLDDPKVHEDEEQSNSIHIRPGHGPLTDIRKVDPATDQAKWLEWLNERAISNPFLVVKHPCDEHRPFHDKEAVALDIELTRVTQPDLIVYGSDNLDFPSISLYDKDPDVREDFEDIIELAEYHFKKSVAERREAAPNHIGVYVWGNHERRLIHFLCKNAPQLRKTILRQFKNMVQEAGVWWLGEVDSVRVGPLKIEHGVNFGRNAAKATLERGGYQVCKWQGHGHNLQFFAMNGEDYSVSSIQSGHLSKYDDNTRAPHYIRAQSMNGLYHQLGTAVADVNLTTRDVFFTNLAFNQDQQGRLYTRFERKTLYGR